MDTALESGIDVVSAIGGLEHQAFIVFERSKEDADGLVAIEVVFCACFEEDVAFVYQENGIPYRHRFEGLRKRFFEFVHAGADLTTGERVQRATHILCDCFCFESLADTWRSGGEHDYASSFAGNDVVEGGAILELGFRAGEDGFLLLLWED